MRGNINKDEGNFTWPQALNIIKKSKQKVFSILLQLSYRPFDSNIYYLHIPCHAPSMGDSCAVPDSMAGVVMRDSDF